MTTHGLSRRGALRGAAGLGLSLPLLAACSGGSDTAADPSGSGGSAPSGGGSGGSGGGGGGSSHAIAETSDIPQGGGAIFTDQRVVITQPSAGEFKGFSNVCTHQGCPVASVDGGTINCNCHGSRFSISDGSVEQGPATAPLPEVKIKVEGTDIVRG